MTQKDSYKMFIIHKVITKILKDFEQ